MKLQDIKQITEMTSTTPYIENGRIIQKQNQKVDGDFNCSNSFLTTLENCPTLVRGEFKASFNELTTLKFSPEHVGNNCSFENNPKLKSLEFAPMYVFGNFFCNSTGITSLHGISRQYLKEIHGTMFFYHCDIKNSILGLLLVKGLEGIKWDSVQSKSDRKFIQKLINHHLEGECDVMECQEELIQAGYKEYAKL